MIAEFIDTWSLFGNAYLSGWFLAVALAAIGVTVVARDHIFVGAAAAQSSTLGIALVMWLGSLAPPHDDDGHHGHLWAIVAAIVFAVLATLLTAIRGSQARESREGRTGWVFLGASSLALLIVAGSPLGLDEVHRLLASSLIGANRFDVIGFALLAVVTLLVLGVHHERLTLLIVDPEMAAAVGMRVGRWDRGLAIWLGLAVGFAIHAAGLLYTFGCLVLPGLAAKRLCREIRPMYGVAPLVALACTVPAFILAHHYDLPPAQAAVALMSVVVALTWTIRR